MTESAQKHTNLPYILPKYLGLKSLYMHVVVCMCLTCEASRWLEVWGSRQGHRRNSEGVHLSWRLHRGRVFCRRGEVDLIVKMVLKLLHQRKTNTEIKTVLPWHYNTVSVTTERNFIDHPSKSICTLYSLGIACMGAGGAASVWLPASQDSHLEVDLPLLAAGHTVH